MCIAILNTKKAGSLPKSYIKNSWDNNDMGAGLLWVKSGRLKVFKSYNYDDFIDEYYKIREDRSVGNIVLHFRIATSGYKGEHNLHPFLVSDDLGFVHNGVISGLGNQKFSDTYEFNELLKGFNHDFLKCKTSKYFISEYITSSKLIFLDNKDTYTIINEERGHWKDNNWFSNKSYESYNDYVYYGNTKVSKTNNKKIGMHSYWGEWAVDDSVNTNEDDNYDFEMFMDLCDIYGLDPDDTFTDEMIAYYMELNGCDSIEDLWIMVYSYSPKKDTDANTTPY